MTKVQPRCCPCTEKHGPSGNGFTRRDFLKGAGVTALGSVAAANLAWPLLAGRAETADELFRPMPLKVKPILVHEVPQRRHQTSWRSWGGIETEADAREEAARIQGELAALAKKADFPVEVLPVSAIRRAADVAAVKDLADADVLLVYAAGGWMDVFDALDKTRQGHDLLLPPQVRAGLPLVRDHQPALPAPAHRRAGRQGRRRRRRGRRQPGRDPLAAAGPVRAAEHAGHEDPGHRRPGAWAQPAGVVPKLVVDKWKLDIVDRLLRRAGQADPRGPGRRRRPSDGPGAGPTPTSTAPRHDAGDRAGVRRERLPARAGLPRPDEEGRLPGDHDQRLHGHDHAAGRDHGLPDAEHAERRRLPGLLRVGLRGDPVRHPAGQHLRPAGVPQRPDLSARRHHHAGPLHGAAEDGRPGRSSRPGS